MAETDGARGAECADVAEMIFERAMAESEGSTKRLALGDNAHSNGGVRIGGGALPSPYSSFRATDARRHRCGEEHVDSVFVDGHNGEVIGYRGPGAGA